jgi:regulatory protein
MKSWGKNKIKNYLKFKSVSEKLINRCFDEIDDGDYENTLIHAYKKYYSNLKNLNDHQKKSKTVKYLLDKGFEYELISEMILKNDEEPR